MRNWDNMRIWFVKNRDVDTKRPYTLFVCTDRQRKMCKKDNKMCAISFREEQLSADFANKKARWFFRACNCYDLKRVSA
jgi:hypothetical protein